MPRIARSATARRACPRETSGAAFIRPRRTLPKPRRSTTPAELFWTVKHGIKMSGMPAWSDHSEEELWATVAFLEKLPRMSEQEYAGLVIASMAHGGHHH
jgi:hypothetical protein